jgi:hypothetical protein
LKQDEILKSRGDSLVEILSQSVTGEEGQNEAPRTLVIGRALTLLNAIHRAFVDTGQEDVYIQAVGTGQEALVEDARRRRALHALLDLISLEGIYPFLSPGVGIPLEQRVMSVLPVGVVAKQSSPQSSTKTECGDLLHRVVDNVLSILGDERSSIQPLIRARILPDLISGAAELAFGSQSTSRNSDIYKYKFHTLIDQ